MIGTQKDEFVISRVPITACDLTLMQGTARWVIVVDAWSNAKPIVALVVKAVYRVQVISVGTIATLGLTPMSTTALPSSSSTPLVTIICAAFVV